MKCQATVNYNHSWWNSIQMSSGLLLPQFRLTSGLLFVQHLSLQLYLPPSRIPFCFMLSLQLVEMVSLCCNLSKVWFMQSIQFFFFLHCQFSGSLLLSNQPLQFLTANDIQMNELATLSWHRSMHIIIITVITMLSIHNICYKPYCNHILFELILVYKSTLLWLLFLLCGFSRYLPWTLGLLTAPRSDQ